MHMMDHLGIAQYISRIGLVLDDNEATALDAGKTAWLSAPVWQPLRALIEDSMVTKDWFELFLLQNFLIDGSVHPLVFQHLDGDIVAKGGAAFSMLTEFIVEWYAESQRWVDAVLKTAAAESAENQQHLSRWLAAWKPRVESAIEPLAQAIFAARGRTIIDGIGNDLRTRAAKAGLTV
jgi:phenol/toluene 2-monooxygenase (NADH) P1/A1